MSGLTHRAIAKPLVAIGILVIVLVATYFGAYYANLKRFELLIVQRNPVFALRVVPDYRIAEEASRVIFYPAGWVDSKMRPNRGPERP